MAKEISDLREGNDGLQKQLEEVNVTLRSKIDELQKTLTQLVTFWDLT